MLQDLVNASYDALKLQAIEFNDQIRRSAYSFEIVNNQLETIGQIANRSEFKQYVKDNKYVNLLRKTMSVNIENDISTISEMQKANRILTVKVSSLPFLGP